MQTIEIPQTGERVVYVAPKEEINLTGIDPASIKIDVLGADFILTNVNTGARLVFPNLGLIMFSEEDVPKFFFDGQPIETQELLSDVGLIENISESDFLSFTSLNTDPNQGTSADELGTTGRQEEIVDATESEDADKVAEMEALLYDIAQFNEPPGARGQLDTGPKNAADVAPEVTTETKRQLKTESQKEEFKEPPEKKKRQPARNKAT